MNKFEKWVVGLPIWVHVIFILLSWWIWIIILAICKAKESKVLAETLKTANLKPTEIKATDVNPTEIKATDIKPTDIKATKIEATDIKPTEIKQGTFSSSNSLFQTLKWLKIYLWAGIFCGIGAGIIGIVSGIGYSFYVALGMTAFAIVLFFLNLRKIEIPNEEISIWNNELKVKPNTTQITEASSKNISTKFKYWIKSTKKSATKIVAVIAIACSFGLLLTGTIIGATGGVDTNIEGTWEYISYRDGTIWPEYGWLNVMCDDDYGYDDDWNTNNLYLKVYEDHTYDVCVGSSAENSTLVYTSTWEYIEGEACPYIFHADPDSWFSGQTQEYDILGNYLGIYEGVFKKI
ncbi:MAG: hypothetical protein PHW00_05005 [Clostridia bacterium]|nr:hypothetical protein [Clostridia bacterium]